MRISHLSRRTWVGIAVIAQAAMLPVAVGGPLSARLTGDEYRLRVGPVDPVDPFRGAYAALSYPDLLPSSAVAPDTGRTRGTVFVPLVRTGDVWSGAALVHGRPASGPYLTCQDEGWRLDCGIDSWFLPQGKAAAAGRSLADGRAVAVVRIDGRGHAALIEVRPGS
jgi:uncharacterized membrane-anchored protein